MALSKKDIQELGAVFAAALNPTEKKTKKKKKAKYVLIVDGQVHNEIATSKKEIDAAAAAITIAATGAGLKIPTIHRAEVTDTIEVSIPVTSLKCPK